MVLHGFKVNKAKLANGTEVAVNDHVYVTLPWSERDGNPYNIARIIEFLPPVTTPKKGSRQKAPSSDIQVRLSLLYRLSDLSLRPSTDNRLLMAAIHTDVQPLSAVRGKCYVRHKDRIEDLTSWKKRPDHFYYIRYYDPFIKRDYELLRTETVNNIPAHVKEVLMSRYEYLITEKEMVADLTDQYRSCCVCDQWAASQESVRCESCKKDYHMSCLNPPLLAKPAKGYSWVCITCSLQRHKDVQDLKFYHTTNGSAPSRPKTNGTKGAKEKVKPATMSHRPDTYYRGWSWRYFGLYTTAEDTLDPDDPIFPRAATRVGPRFQAVVPSWEEQKAAETARLLGEGEAGPSRHIGVERGYDIGQKKHESTIDVISIPSDDLNSYMDEVSCMKLPVPSYDVGRLNRAASTYTALGRDAALRTMRSLKLADFGPIIFDEKQTAAFVEALEYWGGLDTHQTAKSLGKRPAEVLRFSYIWKNKQLKVENEALRQHHKVSTAHARSNKTLGAPSLGKIRTREQSTDSDNEGSLYSNSAVSTSKMECAGCHTRISNNWWRAPRGFPGDAMCESCGTDYRKYGVRTFARADDGKKVEKKEGPPTKKIKGLVSGTSTPVPPPLPKLPPCACCQKMEPKAMMARCKNCTFSVHAGCYGIASQDLGPNWECELCINVKLEECHLEPRCVLCPRQSQILDPETRATKRKSDFDLLSALKPTEGRRWAHILCSAWSPEVQFTNAATFKSVEGIGFIPTNSEGCSICTGSDGVVLSCAVSGCTTSFHPACAWATGYRFGFEFSLAKPGRRGIVTITKFKEETGVMTASIWCKKHDPSSSLEVKEARDNRPIYDMHEIDPELNETALQVYISSYKALPPHESFALLRKATRLDRFLPSIPNPTHSKQCLKCKVDVSPFWHKFTNDKGIVIDGEEGKDICHQCWFKM